MSLLPLVRIWIALSVLATASGWVLSAFGQLNGPGYALAAGLGLVFFLLSRRAWLEGVKPVSWHRLRRRCSRLLPLAFASLAVLAFLGGALYAPSNYDGLTYRLPRVLHWLAQGQWHWIHTVNNRMNDRSCGFEWLMAPVFLATHSDRFLFLINFLPFLLLPGLVYGVFTRLGVHARVAWNWMWLLPTGYNFLLQAASIGNDAFAAVYALAAMDFALRARDSRRISDVWFSLLAAALLTGAKSGNLPLLLPWLIVFLPCVGRLLSRPVAGLLVGLAGLLVSFLPTALLNSYYCADWTGISLEGPTIVMRHPLIGVLGNSAMFLLSNFTPTLFPLAGWWNHAVPYRLPVHIATLIRANFEGDFCQLGEIPTEEWAGLGFGLSCLLAATVLMARFGRRHHPAPRLPWPRKWVLAAPYVSLLFFFASSGMMTLARLVSAYYALLLPACLCGPNTSSLVRCRWWRRATVGVLALAFIALVMTPARPLWPVKTVFSFAGRAVSNHSILQRARDVYRVYAERPDSLAQVRAALPGDCNLVGFAGESDDIEISFWRPYGHRRVADILPGDSAAQIRARNIHDGVVSDAFLRLHHQTIQTWLQQHEAELLVTTQVTTFVSSGPAAWYVVHFNSPASEIKQPFPADTVRNPADSFSTR